MARVFIIHNWGGGPLSAWYPWIQEQLEKLGHRVYIPAMPDTERPVIEKWTGYLSSELRDPDESVFLVGHSIGCQTILRWLEDLPQPHKLGGVLLIAPWLHLNNLDAEAQTIARPWLDT